MVWRIQSYGNFGVALPGNSTSFSETKEPLSMGPNEILFGRLAIIGVLIFLFVGRFLASKSQRDRKEKIR